MTAPGATCQLVWTEGRGTLRHLDHLAYRNIQICWRSRIINNGLISIDSAPECRTILSHENRIRFVLEGQRHFHVFHDTVEVLSVQAAHSARL